MATAVEYRPLRPGAAESRPLTLALGIRPLLKTVGVVGAEVLGDTSAPSTKQAQEGMEQLT